jgi:hypothetical protein
VSGYLSSVSKEQAHNFGMLAIDPADSSKNVFIQLDWNSAQMFLS